MLKLKKKKKNYNLIIAFLIFIFLTFILSIALQKKFIKINENEVPYISTYYINPIVSTNDSVIIDFYITDYNHSNYNNYVYENNTYTETLSSSKFTVKVTIDNTKTIIKHNLKSGDNSINIGSFSKEGEHSFSLLCTDQYGRNSHELFNFFLVKDSYMDTEYIMQNSDLDKYNINNKDSINNGLNTLNGLQKLLDDKKLEGYNKLKLLPGIYRIDYSNPLYIPTKFTLDLNNATVKLNGFTGDSGLMIDLNNTFDSHVINGTIEGDYYEHDYTNSPNNSEWVRGVSITGESKYSSFENLTIKNITGYGAGNGIGISRDDSLYYTYFPSITIGDTFKLGDIDRSSGNEINSNSRTTCDYINISQYSNIGYISISKYLGYQGNSYSTWNLICHFYDENKNYISSVDSYQYRILALPNNSRYMKVTILSKDFPTDLSIQLFRIPTNCAFKNIKFDNCRAVGLAQSAMKNMLVENCEFTNCGQTLAKCAYDAEDGWDMMQDVTLRGLNFNDNPNNDLLTCAGHNFIIENLVCGKICVWERTNSYVIRNCNNIYSVNLGNGNRCRTGYIRFYNNTIKHRLSINENKTLSWPLTIKDCTINGRAEGNINNIFSNCNIGQCLNSNESYNTSLGTGTFIDCNIHDKTGSHHYEGNYYRCTFNNINGNFQRSFKFESCTFTNFKMNCAQENESYSFDNCTMNNFSITFGYWFQGASISISNCTINLEDYLLKLPQYSLKKQLSLSNNKINSNGQNGIILFYDDRIIDSNKIQSDLSLNNNILITPNSKYIIEGLSENTQNIINIIEQNNTLSNNTLLYNPICKNNSNIHIIEK